MKLKKLIVNVKFLHFYSEKKENFFWLWYVEINSIESTDTETAPEIEPKKPKHISEPSNQETHRLPANRSYNDSFVPSVSLNLTKAIAYAIVG